MGQGGVRSKSGGVKNKKWPGPAQLVFIFNLRSKIRAPPVQMFNSCIRALLQLNSSMAMWRFSMRPEMLGSLLELPLTFPNA